MSQNEIQAALTEMTALAAQVEQAKAAEKLAMAHAASLARRAVKRKAEREALEAKLVAGQHAFAARAMGAPAAPAPTPAPAVEALPAARKGKAA